MAILYGTQSNGETLPVQVNEFGQLVAQGLPGEKGEKGDTGDKGDKGDQGDPGLPGADAEIVDERWTPELVFGDLGEALIDVAVADGYIWEMGGLMVLSFYLELNGIGIINPRGYPELTGFPVIVTGGQGSSRRGTGSLGYQTLFKDVVHAIPRLQTSGDRFRFVKQNGGVDGWVETVDINETSTGKLKLSGQFTGRRAPTELITLQAARAEAERANS